MESPVSKPAPATPHRRHHFLIGGLILIATLAAYWNSFHVPLLLDDDRAIAKNATIHHLWPLRDVLSPPPYSGTSGRPVLNVSYALNYAAGGTAVFGYHVFNFTVHVLVALVLFGVVRRTLRSPRLQGQFGGTADELAGLIALLWAVHPLLTGAVTYLSQRAEMLMALLYLLALYGLIRAAGTPGRSARWQIFSVACCWLGMATKEVMVTAPFVIFVYDVIFLSGNPRQAWRARRFYYVGLAASWLLLAWFMLAVSKRTIGFHQGVGSWNYALTECGAVVRYLGLAFWPHPLVFDYGPVFVTQPLTVFPQAIVLLTMLAATMLALRRWPPVGFLGLWFFVLLSPSSSVVPVALQPVAESRMYLPLAAIVAAFVLAAQRVLGTRTRWLVLALVVVAIVTAASRNHDYRDELSLWRDTVAKRPENPRAHDNLGQVLARTGQLDEAMGQFRQGLQLAPDIGRIHYNLGKALQEKGQLAEAISEYGTALRLEPSFADAEVNLAGILAAAGRAPEAQAHLQHALQLDSGDAEIHYDLGLILFRNGQTAAAVREEQRALQLDPGALAARDALGTALFRLGRPDDAIAEYQEVLRLQPDYVATHNNLGNALLAAGQVTEARSQFEQALQLKPDYGAAHTSLGLLELQLGEVERAHDDFVAALRIDPADAEAHFRLGNIFAMSGQLPAALGEWQETVRLRPDDAEAHNNLAIALSQAGRIPEAIQHYEEALRLKPDYERARNNLTELRAQQSSAVPGK